MIAFWELEVEEARPEKVKDRTLENLRVRHPGGQKNRFL